MRMNDHSTRARLPAIAAWVLVLVGASAQAAGEPLPSWNAGAARSRIVAFVQAVTDPMGKDYVAPAARVAVFDNDGTLWSEQPLYFQAAFAFDTAKAMAAKDPAIAANPALAAAARGDLNALVEVIAITHANTTSDEFAERVRQWTKTAQHPTLHRRYTELTFQPMRELLDYLEANGFSTWIVSGGGVEFMRVFSQEVYGIPPERVIGSSIKTKYELRNGVPVIFRLPEIEFVDDKDMEARRHPQGHRQATHCGFRQFRRGLPDARVDDLRPGRPTGNDRASR